ncbi:hypothetical protein D9M72_602540 [compost metagenome]
MEEIHAFWFTLKSVRSAATSAIAEGEHLRAVDGICAACIGCACDSVGVSDCVLVSPLPAAGVVSVPPELFSEGVDVAGSGVAASGTGVV